METDLIPITDSIQLTDAETNVVATQHLARSIKTAFVQLGALLWENKEHAYWSRAGFENWNDYVEQLGIGSESHARRLIQIFQRVTARELSQEDVYEIGLSKTMLLLPVPITDELLSLAKNGTVRDLKEFLGLKVNHNDSSCSITCNRCGVEIIGARWVSKAHDGHAGAKTGDSSRDATNPTPG